MCGSFHSAFAFRELQFISAAYNLNNIYEQTYSTFGASPSAHIPSSMTCARVTKGKIIKYFELFYKRAVFVTRQMHNREFKENSFLSRFFVFFFFKWDTSFNLIPAIICKRTLFHDEIGLYANGYTLRASSTKCNIDVHHSIRRTKNTCMYVFWIKKNNKRLCRRCRGCVSNFTR